MSGFCFTKLNTSCVQNSRAMRYIDDAMPGKRNPMPTTTRNNNHVHYEKNKH